MNEQEKALIMDGLILEKIQEYLSLQSDIGRWHTRISACPEGKFWQLEWHNDDGSTRFSLPPGKPMHTSIFIAYVHGLVDSTHRIIRKIFED